MSCWSWRSQINLKRRLRESQSQHLTSSSHFKLMRAEFPAIQKPNKQKIFFFGNKASSPSSSNKLMNKMLWRCEQAICLRNLFEAEVCVESLFAFGDNVVGLWRLVAPCYILKRHQTHTRLFALQHPTLGGAKRMKKWKGYKWRRKLSLCQQQSHSRSPVPFTPCR